MIGTLLSGRYEILELIGTGGMANVYKAKCTYLNRYVAIKVLKDEFKNDDDFLKRFNIESQAAAGLSHTNIVSVYDIGNENDLHFIVMEYVEGVTLKEYLEQTGALPWEKAVEFATQIASALQHAHRKGIVHRDIKPQNIIVTKDETLKVTDFGIARAVSTFTMKVEDSAMGSVHYCSPEQARGGYTDEKSDVYSLGIVMYEMLTGKLPFESENSVSVALKHMQEEAIAPSMLVSGIPGGVEDIVKKAMEKNQNDRFQTAGEMLIELNWVKQMEGDKAERRAQEEIFKTKKIDVEAVEEGMKKSVKSSKKAKKQKTPKQKKQDRVAVLAGIGSAILFVGLMVFALFWGFTGCQSRERGEIEVPDVVGISLEVAKENYADIVFEETEGEYSSEYERGVILSQDPKYGTKIKSPYVVTVVVSKGPEVVKMPNVVNKSYEDAQEQLAEMGIASIIEYEYSDTWAEDVVMSTDPKAGKDVKVGVDKVILTVNSTKDVAPLKVPNLLNMTEEEAELVLDELNLNTKVVYSSSPAAKKGLVISQNFPEGATVAENTVITITVGSGDGGAEQGDEPSNDPDGNGGATVTKEVTIMLPTDKDQVVVKVTANGKTVYEGSHATSEESVSVPVSGSGNVVVVAYIDNAKVVEKTIKF